MLNRRTRFKESEQRGSEAGRVALSNLCDKESRAFHIEAAAATITTRATLKRSANEANVKSTQL